jgi:co-chaperonin GroES (HSP10)
VSAFTPLRGRIIIRPTGDSGGFAHEFRRAGLVMPDTLAFDPRHQKNQNSLARGVVVAMGAPALTKTGVEVPPGFSVGDEVFHIGQHQSRLYEWNGEMCRACSQEEVVGVVEPDEGDRIAASLADTLPPTEFGAEGLAE